MVRQCTQPKRLRNSAWFKVTDDLDAYDSDYDDISSAKAVLMANLSSYDSNILFEMSKQMSNHVTNWDKVNQETKTLNESLTTELERYKERVKTFEQRLNVDLSSREKFIDSQMDDMIRNRNALKQEIDSLKHALSKQVSKPNSKQPAIQTTHVRTKAPSELLKTRNIFIFKRKCFLDNDRLLKHIICQDVMNIVMHADFVPVNVLSANNKCLVNDNIESERLIHEIDHLFELLLSQDIVHICVNSLATLINYAKMEQVMRKLF
ncbi:hypothetical protein Tco_0491914 [Tanacetum coccineum]